jgi:large subunit ribosomal protein L18
MAISTLIQRNRRHSRVRARVVGTHERPRLSVRVSLRHVTAQVIDDAKGHSMVYVSTVGATDSGHTLTEKATWTGSKVAELAKKAKIKRVVFDRGGRLYHGRLHALAEAARAGGLEF